MLISFDIGIKNLSYCILNKINDDFTIYDWNIVDLTTSSEVNSIEDIQKCCHNNCTKKAYLTFNNHLFFCKLHANKSTYKIVDNCYYKFLKNKNPSKKMISNIIKILNLQLDLKKVYTKNEICDHVTENYILNTRDKTINNNNNNKASDIDLVTVGCNLAYKLSSCLPLDKITKVIIENQISPIANRMKTVQGMLAQFFIDRDIKNIKFISSSNKLKNYNLKKLNYSERKKASITITRDILFKKSSDTSCLDNMSSCNEWLKFFNESNKKDDLSDSFLQGIWFLGIIV